MEEKWIKRIFHFLNYALFIYSTFWKTSISNGNFTKSNQTDKRISKNINGGIESGVPHTIILPANQNFKVIKKNNNKVMFLYKASNLI